MCCIDAFADSNIVTQLQINFIIRLIENWFINETLFINQFTLFN